MIVSHRNPDGDAIGSSLALQRLLQKKGHTVFTIFPSEYPSVFQWLTADMDVLIYDLHTDRSAEVLRKADVIFALDFNALDRIDKMGELIHNLQDAEVVMIDHHIDPEPFAKYAIWRTTASSTAELVWDLFDQGGYRRLVDRDMAECLMTGILTDTGSMSYAVSGELFRKVADLLEAGVDYTLLQERIFNSWSEKYLRLLGHCLASRLEILPQSATGIIYLNKDDFKQFDIQRGDTEGIVNYLLKVSEIRVAALITEQPNIVKFSLRSKGDISVADLAKKHFHGGGHKNAAGGYMHSSLDAAIRKFKEVI